MAGFTYLIYSLIMGNNSAKEAAGTMIIELKIENYSLKARTGGVTDEPEDKELPIWSGVIPLQVVKGVPVTAPDSQSLPIPSHISKNLEIFR